MRAWHDTVKGLFSHSISWKNMGVANINKCTLCNDFGRTWNSSGYRIKLEQSSSGQRFSQRVLYHSSSRLFFCHTLHLCNDGKTQRHYRKSFSSTKICPNMSKPDLLSLSYDSYAKFIPGGQWLRLWLTGCIAGHQISTIYLGLRNFSNKYKNNSN